MNTEKMQTLWRNIGAKNTKFTRTFDEFVQDMQDENNRRTLHSNMPSMFPGFNRTYEQMWGEDMDMLSTPEAHMQQAMETAQAVKKEQEASPALNLRAPSVIRPEDRDGLYNKTDEELDAEIAQFMEAKEGRKKRAEEATYKAEKEQSRIGGLFNNQALNRQYVKESPSQDFVLDKDSEAKLDILQRERAWRRYNNQNSEYKQLGYDLQRSMGELQRLRNKHGGNIDTGGMESYLQKAIQLYEAPSKYGNENGMANWWQGLAEKFSDKDTYLLDIPEVFRTANMAYIVKKMNAGEELTEREEALLNAFFLYGQVQDARQGDLSRGYTIGQGTAESIPFMAEMFLTAGAGAGAKKTIIKSIAKSGNTALAKRVARAFGDEIVEAGGKIALKEVEKGAVERVARGVADDVLMTAFMPTTWSSVNEDILDKYLDKEDYTFKDFMRSFTNSVIETGTERWGGKIVDKTLGKVFSPIDKIWGKTSWGSMLTNDFIQSPFGETGEEYVGAVVNYLRSFNPWYDDKSNAKLRREASHLFSGAGFVDTMLTVLPMSLVGGGVNVVVRTAQKNSERYKQAYNDVANLFVEQGATPEQAAEVLTQLESSEDTREFAKKMRDAYGILCSEYIANDPSKDEYEAFVKHLDEVFGEYVKSARKLNVSAGELQDMYNELSKEEKAGVQAKVEEIAKPIAEAIPAEQQPQAADTPPAPAPKQPVVTEEKKEDEPTKKVEVTVDGVKYTVTSTNAIKFNEDGTLAEGQKLYINGEGGKTLTHKQQDALLPAINQQLAQEKNPEPVPDKVRDVNAEIVVDQSLPLPEQLAQLQQQYQTAQENNDAELMQALEQRIGVVSQQIEDSLTDEERAARAAAEAEAEAAARAAEEEKRIQGIFDQISQAITEKGSKVLSGLTPEQKFIWRWRKQGGSIEDAIERAKAGIEEAKSIRDAEERDYEIEQWQALIDKYAPQKEEILKETKGKNGKDLHDDEKLGNFAGGEEKPLVKVNISSNAGEGLIDKKKGGVVKNRIGKINEDDRQQVLRGLYILRNSNATEAQKRKAEADIDEVQERRMRQMEAMVNAALEDGEGIKLYKIVKGIGVYNNENGEVIEYTYNVQLDVPEGKEELAAQLMAVVAQVCRQDSYIVNYAEGDTNHGYPAKQVRVKLAKPLSLSDEAALSLSFTKTDIGATITDNEITAGFYPNEAEWEKLTDEEKQKAILDFEQSVINLLDKFHYGEDKSVHKADDIASATNETSEQVSAFDNDGRLAGSKIEIRDNYSDFNEGRKEGDERDYSEFYNRGTGGAENEADDVPVQAASIAERIARVQKAYDEHEHDGTEYEEDIDEDEDDTKDAQKSKYAGNDLLADDVVYIRSSRGNNALAREKDGEYYELNSDKPKAKGNWKKEEKKVVFVGDKKYILATNADWDTLKSGSSGYSKNNGYGLRAWDVATGEEVYLDRSKVEREVEQEVGKGKKKTKQIVRVPVWENPENKQRFKDLKRSAKTLDYILDYVVCEYNTPDGEHHEITLRDLLRGASTVGEKGRTSTVKTIDRFVNNILNELGYEDKTENVKANRNLGEEGTIQGIEDPSERVYNDIVDEMRSKIGDAIRVWNDMKGVAKDDNVTIKNGAELNQIVSNVIKLINKKQQETGEDFLAEDRPARLKREQELKSLAEQIKTARERGNKELADELQAQYEQLAGSPLVEDNTDIEAEKRRAKNEEEAETDPTRLALLKTRNGIMLDLMYAQKQGDEEQIEKLQRQVNDLNKRIHDYDEDDIELQAGEETQGSAIRRKAGERMAKVLEDEGVPVHFFTDEESAQYAPDGDAVTFLLSGKVMYGFANENGVFINIDRINPETPLHEFTHYWVRAMRKKDPKKWNRIKGLLKRTKTWQEVLADDGYTRIANNEEAVASEVMARLCGIKWGEIIDDSGKTRYDEMLEQASTVEEKSVLMSVRKAIEDFFRTILEWWNIHIGKTKGFNDLVDRALQTPVQDLMKWSDAIQDMTSEESRKQFDKMEEQQIKSESQERGGETKGNVESGESKLTNFDKKFAETLDKRGSDVLSLQEISELTDLLLDDIRQGNKPLVFERVPLEALQGLLGEQRTLAEALTITSLRSRRKNRALVRDEREVSSSEIASRDASQNEMLLAIASYAKEKGMWIENVIDAFDERYGKENRVSIITGKESGESEVWLDEPNGMVIKAKADNYYETLEEFLEGMLINNWIFGENTQRIVGFGIDRRKYHDAIRVIYETPMVDIDNSTPLTQEEKDRFMADYGFSITDEQVKHDEKKGQKTNYTNGEFIIGDLHNLNIVRDENGEIRCIDPIIRWVKGEHYTEQTEEQEERDAENEEKLDDMFADIEFSIGSPDPSDISTKVAERMEKKAERVLKSAPSMGTKPAQRLDGLARIIYENQDNTWGLYLLQQKINLWRKEHGKKPIPDSQDARSLLIRLGSAISSKIDWFTNHEQKDLENVNKALSEKIAKSALMERFKEDNLIEEDEHGNKFQYQPTAEDLLERYLIARDNIERAEMKEAGRDIAPRGEEEFVQRMGVSMVEYVQMVQDVLSEEEIESLWKAVRTCTNKSITDLYKSGRISAEAYEDMMERQFYVPEKDFAEQNTNEDLGKQKEANRDFRKGSRKSLAASAVAHKAKGGDSMATNVIANIIHDVQNSISVSETNKVRMAMYDLMNDNIDYSEEYGVPRPEKEWFVKVGEDKDGKPIYERSVEKPSEEEMEETKVVNDAIKGLRLTIKDIRKEMKKAKKGTPEWNEAKTRLDDALEYMKELRKDLPFITSSKAAGASILADKRADTPKVEVYVNGDKYVMTFDGMKEVADALNGEYDKRGTMDAFKKLNAIVASLFTTYNPTFFAVNIARDIPYIMLKGGSEYGPMFMARFAKNMTMTGGADMRKAIYQQLAGRLDTSTEIGQQLYNFMMGGGNTGYTQIQDIKTIRKALNASKANGIKQIAELAAKLNEFSELLTRFTAYRTILEMGYSENEALNAAKNLSVNFNMRGAGNTFINFFNSMSMFSNAAIQGAAGFYKTFNTLEKAKRAFFLMVLSPAFFGFLNTLLCPDDDDEEKEIADYYRDNYMCIGSVKVPITQELRPFWRIGVNCALQMQGRRTAGETAQSIISGFTEFGMPVPPALSQTATGLVNGIGEQGVVGGIKQGLISGAVNTIFPQYAEGVKELISNKDFMGNPIVKNYDWSDMPNYTYNKSEAELYKDLAYMFYRLGGGNPDHPSKFTKDGEEIGINWSPKEIKKGMGIVGSTGALQMLCMFYGLGKAAVTDKEVGETVRGRDIPLYGTFVRPEEVSMYRYKVYKEMNEKVKAYDLQLKGWNDDIKNVSSEKKKEELTRQRDEWMQKEREKGFDITEAKKALDAYKKSNAYNVSVKLGRKEDEVKAKHPDWENMQKQSVAVMNEMLMVYKGLKEQVDYIQPPQPARNMPPQRSDNRSRQAPPQRRYAQPPQRKRKE